MKACALDRWENKEGALAAERHARGQTILATEGEQAFIVPGGFGILASIFTLSLLGNSSLEIAMRDRQDSE